MRRLIRVRPRAAFHDLRMVSRTTLRRITGVSCAPTKEALHDGYEVPCTQERPVAQRVAVGQVLQTRARTTCGMPLAARGKFCRSQAPQVLCRLTSERPVLDSGLPVAQIGCYSIVQLHHVNVFPVSLTSLKLDTLKIRCLGPQLHSDQLPPMF